MSRAPVRLMHGHIGQGVACVAGQSHHSGALPYRQALTLGGGLADTLPITAAPVG